MPRKLALSFRRGSAGFALLPLLTSGCFLFAPVDRVAVQVAGTDATAIIEVWGNTTSEGRFEIVVTTPRGTVRRELWEDWGPAQRVSLYLTHRRQLVAMGGGVYTEMVAIPPDSPPKSIALATRPRDNGDDWRYLGAVDRRDAHLAQLSFRSAVQEAECLPLYGEGLSPYRKSHQQSGFCDQQPDVHKNLARGPV